jgi:hypothetical protein
MPLTLEAVTPETDPPWISALCVLEVCGRDPGKLVAAVPHLLGIDDATLRVPWGCGDLGDAGTGALVRVVLRRRAVDTGDDEPANDLATDAGAEPAMLRVVAATVPAAVLRSRAALAQAIDAVREGPGRLAWPVARAAVRIVDLGAMASLLEACLDSTAAGEGDKARGSEGERGPSRVAARGTGAKEEPGPSRVAAGGSGATEEPGPPMPASTTGFATATAITLPEISAEPLIAACCALGCARALAAILDMPLWRHVALTVIGTETALSYDYARPAAALAYWRAVRRAMDALGGGGGGGGSSSGGVSAAAVPPRVMGAAARVAAAAAAETAPTPGGGLFSGLVRGIVQGFPETVRAEGRRILN